VSTPAVAPSYQFYLVRPDNAALLNYSRETFAWHTDYPLGPTQALELVFWPKSQGIGGWIHGRSPIGAQNRSTSGHSWEQEVNLVGFEANQPQFFRPDDYYWGVLVVDMQPAYKRITLLNGEARLFSYRR
jgi:hypothetical protein